MNVCKKCHDEDLCLDMKHYGKPVYTKYDKIVSQKKCHICEFQV